MRNREKQSTINSMDRGNWAMHDDCYWYNGTGQTTTRMTTVIMHKDKD